MVERYVSTRCGVMFCLTNPRSQDVRSIDIAHALSRIYRFGGHTSRPYSVAEHSVWVSKLVQPEHRLAALLHDAAEAYVGDMVAPLKAMLPGFSVIERRIHEAICERFGISPEIPEEVHAADRVALATEAKQLLPLGLNWDCGAKPRDISLTAMWWSEARSYWLRSMKDCMPEGADWFSEDDLKWFEQKPKRHLANAWERDGE